MEFFEGLKIYFINFYILYKLKEKQKNERSLSHLWYVKAVVKRKFSLNS